MNKTTEESNKQMGKQITDLIEELSHRIEDTTKK